ncbi:MAG: ferritin-like domain-containing protein [Actinobacteria bacterium]|nr:ferritin-like domain-containing protein [Actinomycetota bacterium]MBV9935282.1 ferritin-like domain-containing protein [Actinomycetota bacterium]
MVTQEHDIRSGSLEELAQTVTDAEKREAIHTVRAATDVTFTWDYERSRDQLVKLYEKAKTSQWNVSTDIDWDIDVDPWKIARDPNNPLNTTMALERAGTPFEKLSDDEWYDLGAAQQAWVLSQFMHGEQGALICTAQIVETVPWIDAKYYAATQVMDEARHVEVYARYLRDKLAHEFPINVHLRALLDDVVADSRWDMTYLGMQIMIEGLALAAFGFQYQTTPDPLLKQITRFVMADEARHVAFGVLSLKEAYADLTGAQVRERQEFCYEAAVKMRDRFLGQEVWEWAGLPVKECTKVMLDAPMQVEFRKVLFSKIVPNLKKLGLLDAGSVNGNPGWLRQKFGELGVLQFEDWEDTGAEYERMQLEAV